MCVCVCVCVAKGLAETVERRRNKEGSAGVRRDAAEHRIEMGNHGRRVGASWGGQACAMSGQALRHENDWR